jgi:hypothetical protein
VLMRMCDAGAHRARPPQLQHGDPRVPSRRQPRSCVVKSGRRGLFLPLPEYPIHSPGAKGVVAQKCQQLRLDDGIALESRIPRGCWYACKPVRAALHSPGVSTPVGVRSQIMCEKRCRETLVVSRVCTQYSLDNTGINFTFCQAEQRCGTASCHHARWLPAVPHS